MSWVCRIHLGFEDQKIEYVEKRRIKHIGIKKTFKEI